MTQTTQLLGQPDQLTMQLNRLRCNYKQALQVIEHKDAMLDSIEAELCGKTLRIAKLQAQLEKVSKDYVALYIKNEEREKRERLVIHPNLAERVVKLLKLCEHKVKAYVDEQHARIQQKLLRISKKPEQEASVKKVRDIESGKAWLSLNRASPAFNGMYSISDGNNSTLSYFNVETQDFANKTLQPRFWKPIL